MRPNSNMTPTASAPSERLHRFIGMLGVDPDNKRLRDECVSLALQEQQYDWVLATTANLLSRDSSDRDAQFGRASAYVGKRQFDMALPLLNALDETGEATAAVSQNLGLCHYALGDYDQAKAHLEKAYELGERSSGLLRLLISTLHHLGLMDKALEIANTDSEAGREDGALAGVLALLYLDANESGQAARWAARALSLNPNSVDALIVQGTLRTGAFDLASARAQFDKALTLAPTTARAWVGLSLVSLAENNFSTAHKQIEQGLRYMPKHIGSWHVLAWIELMQGRLDQAEAAFQRSLELNRNFAEGHGGLAAVAALRGDRDRAEQLIEIAERLDAACLSCQFARSVLLRGTGDPGAANALLMAALGGLSPKDGGAISKMIAGLTRK